jgi:hypothetical protein
MYGNVMNKFRYGNFKHARYLDDVSKTQFYLNMEITFNDLSRGLIEDGRPDLAVNTLHKFDKEMPDINPNIDTAAQKFFLSQTAYKLGDNQLGNQFVRSVDGYITDQLDYNYEQLKNNNTEALDGRTIQLGMQLLNGMADSAKAGNQLKLSDELAAQLKDYEGKFASLQGK